MLTNYIELKLKSFTKEDEEIIKALHDFELVGRMDGFPPPSYLYSSPLAFLFQDDKFLVARQNGIWQLSELQGKKYELIGEYENLENLIQHFGIKFILGRNYKKNNPFISTTLEFNGKKWMVNQDVIEYFFNNNYIYPDSHFFDILNDFNKYNDFDQRTIKKL